MAGIKYVGIHNWQLYSLPITFKPLRESQPSHSHIQLCLLDCLFPFKTWTSSLCSFQPLATCCMGMRSKEEIPSTETTARNHLSELLGPFCPLLSSVTLGALALSGVRDVYGGDELRSSAILFFRFSFLAN